MCPNSAPESLADALRDFVPHIQFKKQEKRPWGCVTFSKVAVETDGGKSILRFVSHCNYFTIILKN